MDYGTVSYAKRGGDVSRFTLRQGSSVVGRDAASDLVLEGDEVALAHTRLLVSADGCFVVDLGSSGGTFLNLVRLQPNVRQQLRDGDMLRVGPWFLRYAEPAVPPSQPTLQSTPLIAPPVTPSVTPPEVAARMPQTARLPAALSGRSVRRLRGNAGPPRIPAGRRRLGDEVSSYLQYLPPCYHDDMFLGRFLLIFESILSPIERTIDQTHLYLDPRLAPEALLPWLATWVDLVLNENWPAESRRQLILAAADLYRWRGTRRGLSDYIRIYTGYEPTIIEHNPQASDGAAELPANVFKVILNVPDPDLYDQEMIEAIIQAEKPAHTSYILEIR